ncbi:hypothetical protein B0T25DRAFT_599447 [Lasiosphaeria hispida]|uniref:Uncharacterized protein n=1 Tax=Lasiosphaeria hispida TaxID=260671 RepID=A0AAJ0H4M4_9PEZI|nr:hypothetical protein B0T25DRAFT_599447 [Lasiosphaeria hispida]
MSLSYISTVTTPRRVGRRRSISISGDAITPDAAETVHGHRRIVSDTLVHGRVYDTGNNATTSKANTSKEIDVSAQPWFDRSAFPGHSGQFYDEDRVFTIDNSLRESLLTKPMPTGEDLLRFGLFLCPDCIGVVWLMGFVTVELPHTDEVTFATRLSNTPQTYDNSPCEILYHNGLVTLEELARKKRPTPKLSVTERVEDDTDYVEQQGLLRPGCMISSIKDDGTTSEATAGIIVERNGEQHRYPWRRYPRKPEAIQSLLRNTRSPIGHVVERVGKTDIALMKLDDGVKFQNVFFNGHKNRVA